MQPYARDTLITRALPRQAPPYSNPPNLLATEKQKRSTFQSGIGLYPPPPTQSFQRMPQIWHGRPLTGTHNPNDFTPNMLLFNFPFLTIWVFRDSDGLFILYMFSFFSSCWATSRVLICIYIRHRTLLFYFIFFTLVTTGYIDFWFIPTYIHAKYNCHIKNNKCHIHFFRLVNQSFINSGTHGLVEECTWSMNKCKTI